MAETILVDKYCEIKGEIVNDQILYTCTLNQTDIRTNKNKFYIIQLIKTVDGKHVLFTRYGRIGERGVTSYDNCYSQESGKMSFRSSFKKKTGNNWSSDIYKTFEQKKGKYFLTMIDISDVAIPQQIKKNEVASTLNDRLQYLIQLISNKNMMQQSLISLNLDMKKMPLGKIGKPQITRAREIMGEITANIGKQVSLSDLSSQFYTLIPYTVGRRVPPIIDNTEIIGKYMNLLDELEHIVATATIINTSNTDTDKIHPLDKVYNELNTEIAPIEKNGKMWNMINEYIKIAGTHKYNIQLIDIFEINRIGEKEAFEQNCGGIDNHVLLWHGSGLSNWCSIMKNGFRLPNTLNGVVLTGWMFGPGTYFSNMFSKSFGYTRFGDFDNYACLLLSEVALGKQYKITKAEYDINFNKLQTKGCNSTYGMGKTTVMEKYTIDGNVSVPAGDIKKVPFDSSLLYDEFIVYNTQQIKQRYMVIVKNV